MTERQPEDSFKNPELLDPRHTYLAYIFDQPEQQIENIFPLLNQATELGYPVRYWWLSEAMVLDTDEVPDRLIVCVHHPTRDEDAGLDLYESLREKNVEWAELEAASFEEYVAFGKSVLNPAVIDRADGQALFPELRMPFADWVKGENGLELRLRVDEDILATLSETERTQVNSMLASVLQITTAVAQEKETLLKYGAGILNDQLESVAESLKRTANFYKTHWPHVIRRTIDEDELPFD
ncbi:MAG: hypothetical protein IPM53_18045 [Anaerolineaceae bacterium]|nr:hypothetical protein [Anaerolineaceae bacterium]